MKLIQFILAVLEKHGIDGIENLREISSPAVHGYYDLGPRYGKISIEMFDDIVNNPDHYNQFIND